MRLFSCCSASRESGGDDCKINMNPKIFTTTALALWNKAPSDWNAAHKLRQHSTGMAHLENRNRRVQCAMFVRDVVNISYDLCIFQSLAQISISISRIRVHIVSKLGVSHVTVQQARVVFVVFVHRSFCSFPSQRIKLSRGGYYGMGQGSSATNQAPQNQNQCC